MTSIRWSAARVGALIGTLALAGSLGPAAPARAECLGLSIPPPSELNICKKLLEDFTVKAVIGHSNRCKNLGFPECLALPQCCIADTCLLFPECVITDDFIEVAEYVAHAGDVYCGLQEITADEILDDVAQERIADAESLATLTIGGVNSFLYKLGGAQIDVLACSGESLPGSLNDAIINVVRGMANKRIAPVDVDRVDIIPESNATADPWVQPGYQAITLDSLVILRDYLYDAAHGFNHPWRDVLNRKLSGVEESALFTMIHELVHVRQYREMGREAFANDYLAEVLQNGYADASFENEAYEFEGRARFQLELHRRKWVSQVFASTMM